MELSTKQDLEVYTSPIRQRLIRALELAGAPRTPKALSLRLGISPSSVQYHLGKLAGLGVAKADHTERINGITVTYYVPTGATVRIGVSRAECRNERKTLTVQMIQAAVQGCFDALHRLGADAAEDSGDSMTGIVHLTPEDWLPFRDRIHSFFSAHSVPGPGTAPWELALIAYRVEVSP